MLLTSRCSQPASLRRLALLAAAVSFSALAAQPTAAIAPNPAPAPDVLYGALFTDVQRAHVFSDQKTFADAVPRAAPDVILQNYARQKTHPGFDLHRFVERSFLIPEERRMPVPPEPTIEAHIGVLWDLLRRSPDQPAPGSSLLPLPHAYIVPGGRFREVYYWDSYFTMLGLRVSQRDELIESMVDNFAYELATYGLIPNGNRTYYLSRSQPPFLSLMVELLAEKKGPDIWLKYLPALESEYAYWMDRTPGTHHVVKLPDGAELNRYFDRRDTPRAEAFATDEATASSSSRPKADVYRDLRSAAESGWDFSSRWFADGKTLATIETSNVVPIDLNCLLYHLERTLGRARREAGDDERAGAIEAAADRRRAALLRWCWSENDGFFFDFDLARGTRRSAWTLAGATPLFFHVAPREQGNRIARNIRERFLRPGGVVTTLVATGQQWDAPNGWAPLQWMTIRGLADYGENALARDIAQRWVKLNRDVYARTGRLVEKYNVEDVSLRAGGGEYPAQDGFGWTNGVFLALEHEYPEPK